MRRVLDAGLARHAGVSNYSLERWRAAERALGRPVLSNQVRFNLVARGPLGGLVPHAQQQGRLVIAYSPLAQGLLSGRYDAKHLPSGGIRRGSLLFAPENLTRAAGLIDALREVASAHDGTPAQVALAWLIRHPNVVAIPGASGVAQLEANAAAADLELSDEEDVRLVRAAEAFRIDRSLRTRLRRS
jgi:aryl-alcohol dehydrogenase-like predicted oxidoreductase